MEREDKIKIAITAGIAAVILLILVLVLALSGGSNSDEDKLAENIAGYAENGAQDPDKKTDPSATASLEASTEVKAASEGSTEGNASSLAATDEPVSEYLDVAKNSVSGNSFYATNHAVLKNIYKGVQYNVYEQLKELSGYWSEGNMEAVRDLVHLERFEAMSYSLEGSNSFYYYGEMDSESLPNGTGLAVYANDQYYYGQWVNGVRSGDGTWFSFYPGYSNYVVTEHMYSGQWSMDKPGGKGQEHYDYNPGHMNSMDIYLQNIIGVFSDGLYNGNMYVITVDNNGTTTEWDGICSKGNWQAVRNANKDDKGRIPVLSSRLNQDNHIYMTEDGAGGNGVSGIISGGSKIN
ncbi:MAG: hypothetical protein E7307_02985 [Butyrivibrio sp.]|nr:hypothetical protein [Butyrivibrio sp.]